MIPYSFGRSLLPDLACEAGFEMLLKENAWGVKYYPWQRFNIRFLSASELFEAESATGVSMSETSEMIAACKSSNGTVTQEPVYQYYLARPN